MATSHGQLGGQGSNSEHQTPTGSMITVSLSLDRIPEDTIDFTDLGMELKKEKRNSLRFDNEATRVISQTRTERESSVKDNEKSKRFMSCLVVTKLDQSSTVFSNTDVKVGDRLLAIGDYSIPAKPSLSKAERHLRQKVDALRDSLETNQLSTSTALVFRFGRKAMHHLDGQMTLFQSLQTVRFVTAIPNGTLKTVKKIVHKPTLFSRTWLYNNILGDKLNTTKRYETNKKVWVRFSEADEDSAGLSGRSAGSATLELSRFGYLLANIQFCDESSVYVTLSRNYFTAFVGLEALDATTSLHMLKKVSHLDALSISASSLSDSAGVIDQTSQSPSEHRTAGELESSSTGWRWIFSKVFRIPIRNVETFHNSHLLTFDYNYLIGAVNKMNYVRNKKCHKWDFGLFEEMNLGLVMHFFRNEFQFFKNPFLLLGSNTILSLDASRFFSQRNMSLNFSTDIDLNQSFNSLSTNSNTFYADNELFQFLRKIYFKQIKAFNVSVEGNTGEPKAQAFMLQNLLNGANNKYCRNVLMYLVSLNVVYCSILSSSSTKDTATDQYSLKSGGSSVPLLSTRVLKRQVLDVLSDIYEENYGFIEQEMTSTTELGLSLSQIKVLANLGVIFKSFFSFEVLEVSEDVRAKPAKNATHNLYHHISRNVRCCKQVVKLYLDKQQSVISSATVETYNISLHSLTSAMFQKKKSCSSYRRQKNFHIFYDLLSSSLNVDEFTEEDFTLLSVAAEAQCFREDPDARMNRDFSRIEATLSELGFSPSEMKQVGKVLFVILFLGNIKLAVVPGTESFSFDEDARTEEAFTQLGRLLKTEGDYIREFIADANYYSAAKMRMQQVMESLYLTLLKTVVHRVNQSLAAPKESPLGELGFIVFDNPGLFEIDLFQTQRQDMSQLFDFYVHERLTERWGKSLSYDSPLGEKGQVGVQIGEPSLKEKLEAINYQKLNLTSSTVENGLFEFQYLHSLRSVFSRKGADTSLLKRLQPQEAHASGDSSARKSKKNFTIQHFRSYGELIDEEEDTYFKYKKTKLVEQFRSGAESEQSFDQFIQVVKNQDLRDFLIQSRVMLQVEPGHKRTVLSLSTREQLALENQQLKKLFDRRATEQSFLCNLSSSKFGFKRKGAFDGQDLYDQLCLLGLGKLIQLHNLRNYPVARSLSFVIDLLYMYKLIDKKLYVSERRSYLAFKGAKGRKKISISAVVGLCKRLLNGVLGSGSETSSWLIKREFISAKPSSSSLARSGNSISGASHADLGSRSSVADNSRATYVVYISRKAYTVIQKLRYRIRERAAIAIQRRFHNVIQRITAVRRIQRFMTDVVVAPYKSYRLASRLVSLYCASKIQKDYGLVREAAVVIQSFARGVLVKCSPKNVLNGVSLVPRVQAHWRRYIAQKKYGILRVARNNRKTYLKSNEVVLLNSLVVKMSTDAIGPGNEAIYELLLTNRSRLLLIDIYTKSLVGEITSSAKDLHSEEAMLTSTSRLTAESVSVKLDLGEGTGTSKTSVSAFKVSTQYLFSDILESTSTRWVDMIQKVGKFSRTSSLLRLSLERLLSLFSNSFLYYKLAEKRSRKYSSIWNDRLVVLHRSKLFWLKIDSREKDREGKLRQLYEAQSELYSGTLNTSFSSSELFYESASQVYNRSSEPQKKRSVNSYGSSGRRSMFSLNKLNKNFTQLSRISFGSSKSGEPRNMLKEIHKLNYVRYIRITPDTEVSHYSKNTGDASVFEVFNSLTENKMDSLVIRMLHVAEANSFIFFISLLISLEKRAFLYKTYSANKFNSLSKTSSTVVSASRLMFIPRNKSVVRWYNYLDNLLYLVREQHPRTDGASRFQHGLYHLMSSEEYILSHSPMGFGENKTLVKFIKGQRRKIIKEREKNNILRKWIKVKAKLIKTVSKEAVEEFLLGRKVGKSTIRKLKKARLLSFEQLKTLTEPKLGTLALKRDKDVAKLLDIQKELTENSLGGDRRSSTEAAQASSADAEMFDSRVAKVLNEIRKRHLVDKFRFYKVNSIAQAKGLQIDDYAQMGVFDEKEIRLLRLSFAGYEVSTDESAYDVLRALLCNINMSKYYNNFVMKSFGNIYEVGSMSENDLVATFSIESKEEASQLLGAVRHYGQFLKKPPDKRRRDRKMAKQKAPARVKLVWPDRIQWNCPSCHKTYSNEFDSCLNCGYFNNAEYSQREETDRLWLCVHCRRWNRIQNASCENRFCSKPKPNSVVADIVTQDIKKWYSKRSYVRFFDKKRAMAQFPDLAESDKKAAQRRSLYGVGDIIQYVKLSNELRHKGVGFSTLGFIKEVLADDKSYRIVFDIGTNENNDLETVELVILHRDIELVPQETAGSDTDASND